MEKASATFETLHETLHETHEHVWLKYVADDATPRVLFDLKPNYDFGTGEVRIDGLEPLDAIVEEELSELMCSVLGLEEDCALHFATLRALALNITSTNMEDMFPTNTSVVEVL